MPSPVASTPMMSSPLTMETVKSFMYCNPTRSTLDILTSASPSFVGNTTSDRATSEATAAAGAPPTKRALATSVVMMF